MLCVYLSQRWWAVPTLHCSVASSSPASRSGPRRRSALAQAARDFASALEILRKLRTKKYDGRVVDALAAAYEEGKLSSYETRSKAVIQVP